MIRRFINLVEGKSGSDTEVRARSLMAQAIQFARQNDIKMNLRHPYRYAEGEIELTDLYAKTLGTGAGTRVMEYLCSLADNEQFNLFVQPGDLRNKAFYERFGFERGQHGQMVRFPISDDEE